MASRVDRTASSSLIDSVRLPLVAIGVFGVLAGLSAWAVLGEFSLVPRILLAGGILLVGIYVALDPDGTWSRLTGRGTLFAGNALVVALAAVFLLGLLNVLGSRYTNKIDLTANKQFTMSDQSVKIAQALPAAVKVTAFISNNDSRRQDFQTLLNDYANRSGGKITSDLIDPDQRPGDARAAGITSVPTIVYQMGDKKQQSTGTTERDVSTALVKLVRPAKKMYFTVGHGERSLDGSGAQDYSQLKTGLEQDNYTVAPLTLATTRAVPDDADEIVIAGPTNPFLTEEKDALRAYVDGGGKVIVMVGPGSKADLNDLFAKYGVAFTGNVVIDTLRGLPQDPRVLVIDTYGSHAVTADMRDLSIFPIATNITYPTGGAGATVTALAQSSDNSWGSSNLTQLQRQDADPKGPLALAVAIDAGGSTSASSTGGPSGGSRLVLIGTPDLVSNNALQQVPGNQTLFLNAANWITQQDNLVNIQVPDTTPRSVILTSWQSNLVALSSVVLLPLALVAIGAAVWWTRR
ncbi:MAG: hypothetical protein NVSMB2_24600 [Chloroflexota bacterium]